MADKIWVSREWGQNDRAGTMRAIDVQHDESYWAPLYATILYDSDEEETGVWGHPLIVNWQDDAGSEKGNPNTPVFITGEVTLSSPDYREFGTIDNPFYITGDVTWRDRNYSPIGEPTTPIYITGEVTLSTPDYYEFGTLHHPIVVTGLGGAGWPVYATAGEAHIGEVGGNSTPIRATFTRPNDILPYTAKDALADSVGSPTIITFTNASRIVGGSGYITKIRLMTSQVTNTARYRLHLYSVAPVVLGDNVAFTLLIANWANRIGYIDLDACGTEATGSDCAFSQNTDIRLLFKCAAADRNIYGQLETLDAFTPAALQVYNIEIGAEAN